MGQCHDIGYLFISKRHLGICSLVNVLGEKVDLLSKQCLLGIIEIYLEQTKLFEIGKYSGSAILSLLGLSFYRGFIHFKRIYVMADIGNKKRYCERTKIFYQFAL